MAGSRRDKLGSIFSRLTGLLRSGAMKEEDRPIWYDVVKAFPPQPRPPPKRNIPNILYPEDFVRVQFYNQFPDPGATRLADEKQKSVQQRFVDQYLELHKDESVPAGKLFEDTVSILKEGGLRLITHEEKKSADESQMNNRRKNKQRDSDSQHQEDPFFANTTVVSPKPGKQQVKEAASSTVNIDSLFQEPR